MGRHERREGLLDLLDLRRRVGRAHRVERARHPTEQFAARLERHHRVLERRHRAYARDRRDLGRVVRERPLESREVVLRADVGVRREPVGECRGGEKRVGVVGHPSSLMSAGTDRRASEDESAKKLLAKNSLQGYLCIMSDDAKPRRLDPKGSEPTEAEARREGVPRPRRGRAPCPGAPAAGADLRHPQPVRSPDGELPRGAPGRVIRRHQLPPAGPRGPRPHPRSGGQGNRSRALVGAAQGRCLVPRPGGDADAVGSGRHAAGHGRVLPPPAAAAPGLRQPRHHRRVRTSGRRAA